MRVLPFDARCHECKYHLGQIVIIFMFGYSKSKEEKIEICLKNVTLDLEINLVTL